MISWNLYPDDHPDPDKAGYPIPERNGALRWFARDNEVVFWGNNPREVFEQVPHLFKNDGVHIRNKIKSLTFISGSIYDNKELLSKDPGYLGNLLSQEHDIRLRLLYGCWKLRPGDRELYNYPSILDLFTNNFIKPGGGRYITADIAFEGADLFVVWVWEGWRVKRVYTFEKSPGPMIVQTLKNLATEWRVPFSNIAYDREGVGEFLGGYLPGAIGYKSREAPVKASKLSTKPNYASIKAQISHLSSEYLRAASVFIEPGAMQEWQATRFKEELRAVERLETAGLGGLWDITSKRELKAKLKRSPDFWESFILRWLFPLRSTRPSKTA